VMAFDPFTIGYQLSPGRLHNSSAFQVTDWSCMMSPDEVAAGKLKPPDFIIQCN